MRINQKILGQLKEKVGKFSHNLIYVNNEEKNYVFLLKTKLKKYVLKIKNSADKTSFDNEIANRKILKSILDKAKIKNYAITQIISYDKNKQWILFRHENFCTLYQLMNKNQKDFKKVICMVYNTFFQRLFKTYKPNKKIPGDFSLHDLGYYKGKLYFYDLEDNKSIIRFYVDLYLKVCKYYWRAVKKKQLKQQKFLKEILSYIKNNAKKFNKNKLNSIIFKRLNTKTFKEFKTKEYKGRINKELF